MSVADVSPTVHKQVCPVSRCQPSVNIQNVRLFHINSRATIRIFQPVNVLVIWLRSIYAFIFDSCSIALGRRWRTGSTGDKQSVKVLRLAISRRGGANVDADKAGFGCIVHHLNVVKVVVGHDVRDWRDFVDQDSCVGAGCLVTRGIGKDGEVLEYRVPGLVDFKDRSPGQAIPEKGRVTRSRSPCGADSRLSLRLAPVHRDSPALRNIHLAGELDGAGVREDECSSTPTRIASGVNCILHGRRVIGRSAARNSVIPRIEDGLGLINGRLTDAVGNQVGSGGHAGRRGRGRNTGT